MITSAQNNHIKQVNALKKNKERKKTGLFCVEGIKMFNEIPDEWDIDNIYVSEAFSNNHLDSIKKEEYRYKVNIVKDNLFKQISDTKTPQGIIATVRQKKYQVGDLLEKDDPFMLIIEDLQDPGNLGTIIRTADAAGVDGIILSKNTVDLYNPKVVRATMASIFHIPIVMDVDLISTINELKQSGIQTLAAHLKGKKYPYSVDLTKATAILIGNEGNGLSDEVAQSSDEYVRIPMLGGAESLNAAIASSILVYEVVRQRISQI